MSDDLTIDIEDEVLEVLTRMAERVGLSVEEYARQAIEKSVYKESASLESEPK